MASKTTRINQTRERLLDTFCSYAMCAHDWEPEAEGDYNDLVEEVNEILEDIFNKKED